MMVRAEDIIKQAARWCAEGHKVALATVIKTWGSSPCPVGSQLVINDARQFAGSVSGGCIEGAVVGEAIKIIEGAQPTTFKFSVTDEQALNVGLTCGGSVNVFVNAVDPEGILNDLNSAIENRTPLALVTRLFCGVQNLVSEARLYGPLHLSDALVEAAHAAYANRTSTVFEDVDDTGEDFFIHAFAPAPRIFVVGAGHISQAMAPMASLAGFDVTIIDPRQAFITRDRFADTPLADVWPDEFLGANRPDPSTAVITLVHDPKIDDPALEIAIRSDAFYVGALGSKQTHENRVSRFITNGYSEQELGRIHAPIGLDLGGRKPPEIAVSILAEIIQVWSGKTP